MTLKSLFAEYRRLIQVPCTSTKYTEKYAGKRNVINSIYVEKTSNDSLEGQRFDPKFLSILKV